MPVAAGPWTFTTSEALYQARKFGARPDIQQRIADAPTARDAAAIGRAPGLGIDAGWNAKRVRVSPGQWERLEQAAQGTPYSPKQVLVQLAMEALDRREWPRNDTEMRVARAPLFAAQALARKLIADGHENEVQEIRDFISTIVPDPDTIPPTAEQPSAHHDDTENNDSHK